MSSLTPSVSALQIRKVQRGIRLLDRELPGWYERFSMRTITLLDVNSPRLCVLATVEPDQDHFDTFRIMAQKHISHASCYGFMVESSNPHDLEVINALWRNEIMQRLIRSGVGTRAFSFSISKMLQCSQLCQKAN